MNINQISKFIKHLINFSTSLLVLLLTAPVLGQQTPLWNQEEFGHSEQITAETFSPDGMYYVSGSDDRTILIRIASTGQEVRRLTTGHTGMINSLAYSPNGSIIASASSDKTIRLWNSLTGVEIGSITAHTAEVTSVIFSPDGTQLISASADETIRLWNVNDRQELAQLTGHTGAVTSLSFGPDGNQLISGSADQTVRIWDISARQAIRTLTGHTDVVTSVSFSSSLSSIASGSDDGTIRLWDFNSGRGLIEEPISFHEGLVKDVIFSSDDRWMLSLSENKVFMLTEFSRFGRVSSTRFRFTGGNPINSLSISPDNRYASLGSSTQTRGGRKFGATLLIDIPRLRQEGMFVFKRYIAPTLLTHSVAFSNDGEQFVSGSWDGTLRLNATHSGEVLRRFNTISVSSIIAVAISPDGSRIISGSTDSENSLRIWDTNSGNVIDSLSENSQEITAVAFSPDGTQFATGSTDGRVQLWDVQTGKILTDLTGHTGQINSVAYSLDGDLLASGSDDQTVRIWNIDSSSQFKTFSQHTLEVSSVVFAPSGNQLLSGSSDGLIRLWDISSEEVVQEIRAHRSQISSIDISEDGNEILSGSYDGTARVWNASSGDEIKRFEHQGQVFSVDMSNDDQFVLTAGQNKVSLWDNNNQLQFTSEIKDQTFIIGQPITPLTFPEVIGGVTPVMYTLSPSVPDGLSFNASIRQLSGTPTVVTSPQLFTYAATDSRGLDGQLTFKIAIISNVSNDREALPEVFTLVGNYPNPFTETTNLLIDLPSATTINVEVMDIIGRMIMSIPPTNLQGGWSRSITINGQSLPAGIYLYRLTAHSSSGTSVYTGQFVRIR